MILGNSYNWHIYKEDAWNYKAAMEEQMMCMTLHEGEEMDQHFHSRNPRQSSWATMAQLSGLAYQNMAHYQLDLQLALWNLQGVCATPGRDVKQHWIWHMHVAVGTDPISEGMRPVTTTIELDEKFVATLPACRGRWISPAPTATRWAVRFSCTCMHRSLSHSMALTDQQLHKLPKDHGMAAPHPLKHEPFIFLISHIFITGNNNRRFAPKKPQKWG